MAVNNEVLGPISTPIIVAQYPRVAMEPTNDGWL
jgi:hypothetical protein